MKKEAFFKLMTGFSASGEGFVTKKWKRSYTRHFEQDKGYIYECPNGLKVAISRKDNNSSWQVTEINTGLGIGIMCDTIKEAITQTEKASLSIVERLMRSEEVKSIALYLVDYKKLLNAV